MRPFHIGKYQVVEVLGRGPLGTVYEAIDPSDGSRCALRAFTKPKGANDENWRLAVERFNRELQPVLGLSHPNIGAIYEFWEQNDIYVVRSEYFKAQNVRQLIDAQVRLDVGRTVQIATAVCRALQFAHEKGAVHSDLTPFNILYVPGQLTKVINFGLGHARPKTESPYRAPEQVLGHEAEARSDLYSLGVVLYEMLSGHNPFAEADAKAMGEAILQRTPPPIAEVPGWLNGLVARLMAKNPEHRYQSAKEALQVLEEQGAGAAAQEAAAVASVLDLQPARPAPSLADYRQLATSDLRSYRRLLADRETQRILRRRAIIRWSVRAVLLFAVGGVLYWDNARGGPTARLVERLAALRPVGQIHQLADFVPDTARQAEAQLALQALATALEMAHTDSGYPERLNLETLEELGLGKGGAKPILLPFAGQRLARYERTGTGYRVIARLDDDKKTPLVLENGKVKKAVR